jgi:hypothetical protein
VYQEYSMLQTGTCQGKGLSQGPAFRDSEVLFVITSTFFHNLPAIFPKYYILRIRIHLMAH